MLTQLIRDFKAKVKTQPVIGPFSKTEDPAFIEAMGHAGFDFVILDLEHGPNNVKGIQNLIRAAQITGLLPIVRIKEDTPSLIGEVLDVGAGGIQVPQVTTAEAAREVIKRARFAPEGMRGVCRFVRAADYSSLDRFAYFRQANEAVLVLQLEGSEAIRNLDSILEVEGFDIIFIGPYDLSQSLGVAGQIDHPLVAEKMVEIIGKCQAKGVAVGTFVDTIENAIRWKAAGVNYLAYSVDVGIFYEQCRNIRSTVLNE